jgi:hypothetical protein
VEAGRIGGQAIQDPAESLDTRGLVPVKTADTDQGRSCSLIAHATEDTRRKVAIFLGRR